MDRTKKTISIMLLLFLVILPVAGEDILISEQWFNSGNDTVRQGTILSDAYFTNENTSQKIIEIITKWWFQNGAFPFRNQTNVNDSWFTCHNRSCIRFDYWFTGNNNTLFNYWFLCNNNKQFQYWFNNSNGTRIAVMVFDTDFKCNNTSGYVAPVKPPNTFHFDLDFLKGIDINYITYFGIALLIIIVMYYVIKNIQKRRKKPGPPKLDFEKENKRIGPPKLKIP